MVRAWPLVLLSAGCSDWFDGIDNIEEAKERKRSVAVAKELQRGAPPSPQLNNVLVVDRELPASVLDGPSVAELGTDTPATVILVVLDTVRADHLSVCGYERPTSSAFKTLIDMGGAFTCDAYSPATWTTPSHATYFTGEDVDAHDMHRKGLRLGDEYETLAEIYEARGYQTLSISANPVLKEQTGLLQGFQRALTPKGLNSGLRGEGFSRIVRSELAKLDKSKPLFLFLNLFDAHDPYPAIPEAPDWLPTRDAFHFNPNVKNPTSPYQRFFKGEMTAQERQAWLDHATDTYDWGVAITDRNLGRVLKFVQKGGWIDHGVRIVVTSDHGEHLGEHDLVRHDGLPWEGVVKVPLYFFDTTRKAPELPLPMPAGHVFELIANGTLDPDIGLPVSSSVDYGKPDPRYVDAVAVWGKDGQKALWRNGVSELYDLAKDPDELAPMPLAGPLAGELARLVDVHAASKERAFAAEADEGVIEMLDELGYVEAGME
jgi:hypothetical protein